MGKLLLALIALISVCALFQWPGYMVHDDAAERLADAKDWPSKLTARLKGEKGDPDAPDLPDGMTESEGGQLVAHVKYPYAMTLQNPAGIELPATVLGRGPDFVQFRRNTDGKLFEQRFSVFSEASQIQLRAIPVTLHANDFGSVTRRGLPATPRETMAQGRVKDIERNNQRIKEQQAVLSNPSMTSSQKSMAKHSLNKLKAENMRLKARQ